MCECGCKLPTGCDTALGCGHHTGAPTQQRIWAILRLTRTGEDGQRYWKKKIGDGWRRLLSEHFEALNRAIDASWCHNLINVKGICGHCGSSDGNRFVVTCGIYGQGFDGYLCKPCTEAFRRFEFSTADLVKIDATT